MYVTLEQLDAAEINVSLLREIYREQRYEEALARLFSDPAEVADAVQANDEIQFQLVRLLDAVERLGPDRMRVEHRRLAEVHAAAVCLYVEMGEHLSKLAQRIAED